jgi:hypothetical protein
MAAHRIPLDGRIPATGIPKRTTYNPLKYQRCIILSARSDYNIRIRADEDYRIAIPGSFSVPEELPPGSLPFHSPYRGNPPNFLVIKRNFLAACLLLILTDISEQISFRRIGSMERNNYNVRSIK